MTPAFAIRGLPKGIFRGEERYGPQVDMCHFGLVTQMGVKAHAVRPLGADNFDATPCEPWWSILGAILIQL